MLKRRPIEPGVPCFITKTLSSFFFFFKISKSVFQVLLLICITHSNMLISQEHVVGSTFKLIGRDGDICFILSFVFFFVNLDRSDFTRNQYHQEQSLNP